MFYVCALVFVVCSVFLYADVSYQTFCDQEIHKTCSTNFKSIEADLKYNDYYNKATIIMERVVKLETLEDTFIHEVFMERTWTKLLNPIGVVYSEIIKELFFKC